jgi:hypothetical protein
MDRELEGGVRPRAGLKKFLLDALLTLRQPKLLPPALILLLLLTFSNVFILQNMPPNGVAPSAGFLVAAVVRVAGLLLIAVAILRMLTESRRRLWLPDGGFWLYALTFAAGVAAGALARAMIGDGTDVFTLIVSNVLTTLLLSPLVVWFVAIAVARPLAWRPGPWLRDLRHWWVPVVLWTLLLVMPMGVLHASIDVQLAKGVGDRFWPLALFDGLLSTAMALIGLAINAAAYRYVAQSHSSRLSAQA